MRTIDQITAELTSEREERDYINSRIDRWEGTLGDLTPGTREHSNAVHRLISLNIRLNETERLIRLLRIERDEARALQAA